MRNNLGDGERYELWCFFLISFAWELTQQEALLSLSQNFVYIEHKNLAFRGGRVTRVTLKFCWLTWFGQILQVECRVGRVTRVSPKWLCWIYLVWIDSSSWMQGRSSHKGQWLDWLYLVWADYSIFHAFLALIRSCILLRLIIWFELKWNI